LFAANSNKDSGLLLLQQASRSLPNAARGAVGCGRTRAEQSPQPARSGHNRVAASKTVFFPAQYRISQMYHAGNKPLSDSGFRGFLPWAGQRGRAFFLFGPAADMVWLVFDLGKKEK
jgi:hypothetical protein